MRAADCATVSGVHRRNLDRRNVRGARQWRDRQGDIFRHGSVHCIYFPWPCASAFGQVFLQYQTQMGIVAGAVIILFGLHFLGIIKIPFLYREARFDAGNRGGSSFGAYILGLAFAFGWTPCIGPILGTILSLAAQEGSVQRGVVMMAFYAGGLGIPFILAAMFMRRFVKAMNKFKKHMGLIEKIMGALLVVVGLLLVTGLFSELSFWLLENVPSLGAIG